MIALRQRYIRIREPNLRLVNVAYARSEITPDHPLELSGFAARQGRSEGVHDPLYCSALLLSGPARGGEERLLIVSLDLLALPRELAFHLRSVAGQKLGLKADQVAVCTTHTHYAPATVFLRKAGQVDEEYVRYVKERFKETVEALSEPREAEITFSSAEARGLVVNRAYGGFQDEGISAVHFNPKGGGKRISLVNFSCHPVVLGPKSRLISADYPAYVYSYYREKGEEAIFLNGASGDINPYTSIGHLHFGGFEDAEKIGKSIADLTYEDGETVAPLFSWGDRHVLLERESLSVDEDTLKKLASEKMARGDHLNPVTGIPERIEGEVLLDWLEDVKREKPEPVEAEAQAFAISQDVALVGFSGELFSSIGRQVKAGSPFRQTIVVGYANGVVGYIPDEKSFQLSTYEAAEAYKYYDVFPFKKDVGRAAAEAMISALHLAKGT